MKPRSNLFALCSSLCALSSPLFAQPFARQVEPFPVQANGSPIALPFAGGVNSPVHQFVDIDGDGDYDLFVFDNDLGVDFYRNEGTRLAPNFKLRNELAILPKFSVWFRFVDFDGDGKIDLCTEDTTFQGVRVYKNTSTGSSLQFTQIIATLKDTTGADVYTGGNSVPAFVDIDADGDFDLFSSNLTGTVNFYKNVGTRTLPRYAFVTSNWENILIIGDSCGTTLAPVRLTAHGAAAYTFADIDGDGDYDMFIGDLFSTGVFFLRNIGTPQAPHMQCVTPRFPQNDPLNTGGFNQISLVDIDGDNDRDLFVGVLAGIVQRNGFIFFRNIGTPTNYLFQRVTSNYISTIDVGMTAHPAFVDIDNDGDQDMFIGSLNGELAFYRNIGSSTSPSFTLVDSTYIIVEGGYSFAPAFVDIDNDGDKDLFAGMYDGKLIFYRNNGSPQAQQFVRTAFVTDTIALGTTATPVFVDIDNDGDKDLFIGRKDGTIYFYLNTGTASNFIPTLVTRTFLSINLGNDTFLNPTFADVDGDGDFDFFFGAQDGRLEYYENTGTPTVAQFVRRTELYANIAPTQETAPTFVDIDGDGDQDLLVGVRKGGIHFYKNHRLGTAAEEVDVPRATQLLQNYPNPFNPTTEIRYQISEVRGQKSEVSHVTLKVYDVLGREVATLVNQVMRVGTYTSTWDASGFSSGVYFYRLSTPTATLTRKMTLMK